MTSLLCARDILRTALTVGLVTAIVGSPAVWGTTLTVPDNVPTVQAALDSTWLGRTPIDTVFVRAGHYPERLECRAPVVLIGLPAASGERPSVDALVQDGSGEWHDSQFRDLHFRGAVTISIAPALVEFRGCQIDSGLTCELDPPRALRLVRCAVSGEVHVYGGGTLDVDSCTVRGQVRVDTYDEFARVRDNEFIGPGPFAIGVGGTAVVVEGNRVRGFDGGIFAGGENSLIVRNNIVEDCALLGIRANLGTGLIEGNRVERCGTGLAVEWSRDGAYVRDNVVLDCSGEGLRVLGQYGGDVVERNVVGRCAGDGFRIVRNLYNYDYARVHNNTSFANGRSGFVVESETGLPSDVSRNIAYGNGAYGLLSVGAVPATAACNDWFSNVAGAVGGLDSSGTGVSLDPGFCDLAGGDVRLRGDSPLLDLPGCGLVGALGVGCAVTATVVSRFTARRVASGIEIVWEVGVGSTASEVWLERAEGDSRAPWIRPATVRSRNGRGEVELDQDAAAQSVYWYRLVAVDEYSTVVIGLPIRVEAEFGRTFKLTQVGPTPTSGPIRIGFALPRQAAVEVDVFDVQGRRVGSPARGVWPAGEHMVEWPGSAGGSVAGAGVYVVRFRYPGGEDRRRVIRTP